MVEFSNDEIKCIGTFESITNAPVRDCIITDKSIVFLVTPGDLGRAIGKKGANITRVRKVFNRQVLVFEDNDELEPFVRSLFSPIPIKNINIHEKKDSKTVYVIVDDAHRGSAIGKGGERVKLHRALLQRKFGCDLRLHSK